MYVGGFGLDSGERNLPAIQPDIETEKETRPTMVRRTKEEASATRSLILDSAERVFEEHGVSGASLQQIAQAAGLTRGAIYWHFEDKAALFHAMMERIHLPLKESLRGLREAEPGEPLKHIRAMLVSALRQVAGNAQTRRVFGIAAHKVEYAGELGLLRERHISGRDACVADIERDLRQARRYGQVGKRIPTRAAALGLHALVDGLIHNWVLAPHGFDLVKVGTHALDAYLTGLGAGQDASVKPAPMA